VTALVAPYGGTLVQLLLSEEARKEQLREANALPFIQLSDRSLNDLELLTVGACSPLDRFMGRADYERVLKEMRLADGTFWPIPITLPVQNGEAICLEKELALRNARNELIAVMTVEEVFPWNLETEAAALLDRVDSRHPLVAEMSGWGPLCISGPLRVFHLPKYHDFVSIRRTPAQVRSFLRQLGFENVVAFQTHRFPQLLHEGFTKRIVAECNGTLLYQPIVGLSKPGDIEYYARIRSYRAVVEKHYDSKRTLLNLLPLATRLAGPKEALWHAIICRNYGANHLIVGDGPPGLEADSFEQPFFDPDQVQETVATYSAEVGVAMIPFSEGIDPAREDESNQIGRTSGAHRETAEILSEVFPPRHKQGFCVWLTGLSCAGKSVTAGVLTSLLLERGRQVTLLDGDVVRTHLSKGLGFSEADRNTNIRRIGFVASEIVRHGGGVLCAVISPYRATRDQCRDMVDPDHFVEVFIDTPLSICEQRDAKGLYAKARRGEIKGFTGIDDPYEPPLSPELVLTTTDRSPEENARRIVDYLLKRGFLKEMESPHQQQRGTLDLKG
jgi:sulfate adenylyltransferase